MGRGLTLPFQHGHDVPCGISLTEREERTNTVQTYCASYVWSLVAIPNQVTKKTDNECA